MSRRSERAKRRAAVQESAEGPVMRPKLEAKDQPIGWITPFIYSIFAFLISVRERLVGPAYVTVVSHDRLITASKTRAKRVDTLVASCWARLFCHRMVLGELGSRTVGFPHARKVDRYYLSRMAHNRHPGRFIAMGSFSDFSASWRPEAGYHLSSSHRYYWVTQLCRTHTVFWRPLLGLAGFNLRST